MDDTADLTIEIAPLVPRKRGLARIDHLITYTDLVLTAMTWLKGAGPKIESLSDSVDDIVRCHPDASIAAVHLFHDHRPSSARAVHTAFLCALTSLRLGLGAEQRRTIIAAALTCNAGLQKLEDKLHHQSSPPGPDEIRSMRSHPTLSAEILERTGVTEPAWLEIVRQHHERPDGSGYPAGLANDEIRFEALMVGLAEKYTAYVTPNPHRSAQTARTALRHVFEDPAYSNYSSLVAAFIKELTIFPPGSFVRLARDEEAVVVARGEDALRPTVALIPSTQDVSWGEPFSVNEGRIEESLPVRQLRVDHRSLWTPSNERRGL